MEHSRQTRQGCAPLTLMGCGCGLLGMISILLVFLMLSYLYVKERQDQAWNRRDFALCQQRLLYLGKALASYEQDNHHLPRRLDELQPYYLYSPDKLRCPLEDKHIGEQFHYNPAANKPLDAVITCDNHGQATIILLRNGQLRLRSKLFRRRH